MKKRSLCFLMAICFLFILLPKVYANATEEMTGPIEQVILGSDYNCRFSVALDAKGTLWVWGKGTAGILGDGSGDSFKPIKVLENVVSFKTKYPDAVCALKSDGTLWTWGSSFNDNNATLGNGTNSGSDTPVKILDHVTTFSFSNPCYAIRTDGSLWVWGTNEYGQLGDGTTESRNVPVKIMENVTVASLKASSYAIKIDGSLWTWGFNENGQLGDGTKENCSTPVRIINDVAKANIVQYNDVNANSVIQNDGTLWTWGKNSFGQLGDGTTEDQYTPVRVTDNVDLVYSSGGVTAVLKTDGSLWTWGLNSEGQLGDGTITNRYTPARVMDGIASVQRIGSSCAVIKSDKSLWAWGKNDNGQVGDGTTEHRSTPVKIMNDVSAYQSDGYNYHFVLKTDGSLWSWGVLNRWGQLGDGTTESRISPVKILDNVASIELGGDYIGGYLRTVAAIKTDGTLWIWGNNGNGQVGDGTTDSCCYPFKVLEDAAKVQIRGGLSSAAITADGSLWTWGFNGEGQIGDGTIENNRTTPVQITAQPRTDLTLPDAAKYTPYKYAFSGGSGYTLKSGSLPDGLTLSADGVIFGIPMELGVFSFTIADSSGKQYNCTLSVLWQGGVDVEQYNEPGYGFVETATDDGRVHDQQVSSVEELEPQTMHCEGPYSEFRALYLDGRLLKRDVDYTARPGSAIIDVMEETLESAGSGTHVLTAEFQTNDGNGVLSTKYTTQKYTITGIPGTDVTVIVKGVTVIWTDAEPYINTDNRTMVPFRVIANALGLTVDWDGTTREAIFSDGTRTIYFPLDSKIARTSTGGTVAMDTAAVSINGRSYAPVRYLAEFFGYKVSWNGLTRTVGID